MMIATGTRYSRSHGAIHDNCVVGRTTSVEDHIPVPMDVFLRVYALRMTTAYRWRNRILSANSTSDTLLLVTLFRLVWRPRMERQAYYKHWWHNAG